MAIRLHGSASCCGPLPDPAVLGGKLTAFDFISNLCELEFLLSIIDFFMIEVAKYDVL